MNRTSARRLALHRVTVAPAVAALAVLTLLVARPATPATPQASPAADVTVAGGADVSIGSTTATPGTVQIEPGQSVRWTNASGTVRFVSSDGGELESGVIPDGGGYAVAFPRRGTYRYTVRPGGFTGIVEVGDRAIDGPADATVTDHLVDVPFPLLDPADLSIHPTFAWKASRTRALVGFADGTTVQQANDALSGAGVVVIGVLADEGELLVAAPDSPDFSALDGALAKLRAEPVVAYARDGRRGHPGRSAPGRDRRRRRDDLEARLGRAGHRGRRRRRRQLGPRDGPGTAGVEPAAGGRRLRLRGAPRAVRQRLRHRDRRAAGRGHRPRAVLRPRRHRLRREPAEHDQDRLLRGA